MTTVQGAAAGDRVEVIHIVRGSLVSVTNRRVRIFLEEPDSIGRAYLDFPVDTITVKVLPPPAKVGDKITTVEGLRALPVGTVGRTNNGTVAEKGDNNLWYLTGTFHPVHDPALRLPFTIIDLPKED